jgi:hypothetical protein
MIFGLQVILIIFALVMIYFAYLHYRKGNLNILEMRVWFLAWLFTLIVVSFPDILRTYSKTYLDTRLFDVMVVGAFLLVLTMVSIVYIKVRSMDKKLEEYVRKEALKKIKKPTFSSKSKT